MTRLGPRFGIRLSLAAMLVISSAAPDVVAQSAADKATARQVATEGISLYNSGNYAEALDRLRRAQALYDAPVHLLYIARAEVKLSQLVEAAEDYRSLVRSTLPPKAPQAFVDAVEEGKKELAELEPRIPTLQLDLQPGNIEGVELTIDDKPVPAAVIGIRRPVNPGSHRIQVKAPGYKQVESSVDVKESETKTLTVTLERDETAPAPAAGAAATAASAEQKGAAESGAGEPSKIGFLVGVRLGLSLPLGTIRKNAATGNDLESSELVKAGGGLELHGGVRFAKYFTPVLFLEVHGLTPSDDIRPPPGITFDNTATASAFGLGVMVGTPRNELGAFGELDLVFRQAYDIKHKVVNVDCEVTRTFSGTALRIGGGGVIPLASFLHLTPFAMASIGQFGKESRSENNCPGPLPEPYATGNFDLSKNDEQAVHTLIFVGVGGDFVLGGDRPQPAK